MPKKDRAGLGPKDYGKDALPPPPEPVDPRDEKAVNKGGRPMAHESVKFWLEVFDGMSKEQVRAFAAKEVYIKAAGEYYDFDSLPMRGVRAYNMLRDSLEDLNHAKYVEDRMEGAPVQKVEVEGLDQINDIKKNVAKLIGADANPPSIPGQG